MKLPLKTYIYKYATEHSPFTVDQLMKDLKPIYGGERHFKIKNVQKYLIAYSGVKVIVPVSIDEKDSGKDLEFTITEYGKQSSKYIAGAS